jgi:excisionase family DNA binding protein
MDDKIQQRYLSVRQAAVYMGLSEKALYAWVEKGRMPAHKLGRIWRFDRQELDDFIRGARQGV